MFAGKYSAQDYDDYAIAVAVRTLLRSFGRSEFQGIYECSGTEPTDTQLSLIMRTPRDLQHPPEYNDYTVSFQCLNTAQELE